MKTRKHPRGGGGRSKEPLSVDRKKEDTPPSDAPSQQDGTQGEGAETEIAPPFSVVGIGASAGGLEAFTQLLRALPTDTGLAFVLVQHLSPTHESALAEILSRATSMPVTEVADEPRLQPNRVYVIPPDRNMVIVRGHLRLLPREAGGRQHPIDQFFRSLAETQRQMAMGVVLSGTATDGTLGLEEIKAEGGITFAQDETAQHGGMPQSAADSGCVDFVLPPEGIAAEIARIATHPYVAASPDDPAGKTSGESPDGHEGLSQIIHLLRNGTGVDFSEYKVNTLLRRVRRRMVLKKTESTHDYVMHLRDDSEELEALYQDILINVTSFFRDPPVFTALKKVILPALFKHRSPRDPIRFWVLGCSTGEEAYSMAILLAEEGLLGRSRIYATDLSDDLLTQARRGIYPLAAMREYTAAYHQSGGTGDFSSYYTADHQRAIFREDLRRACVFSQHNLVSDHSFNQFQLILCRNVMIYFSTALRDRVHELLYDSLVNFGVLVLGLRETLSPTPREASFEALDEGLRLYRRVR